MPKCSTTFQIWVLFLVSGHNLLQEQGRGIGWKDWKRSSIPHCPRPLESPPLPPLGGVAAKGKTSGNGSASTHCSVCGDSAPDHVHYGSVTCFSCRAFFRRSVSSGVDAGEGVCSFHIVMVFRHEHKLITLKNSFFTLKTLVLFCPS